MGKELDKVQIRYEGKNYGLMSYQAERMAVVLVDEGKVPVMLQLCVLKLDRQDAEMWIAANSMGGQKHVIVPVEMTILPHMEKATTE